MTHIPMLVGKVLRRKGCYSGTAPNKFDVVRSMYPNHKMCFDLFFGTTFVSYSEENSELREMLFS